MARKRVNIIKYIVKKTLKKVKEFFAQISDSPKPEDDDNIIVKQPTNNNIIEENFDISYEGKVKSSNFVNLMKGVYEKTTENPKTKINNKLEELVENNDSDDEELDELEGFLCDSDSDSDCGYYDYEDKLSIKETIKKFFNDIDINNIDKNLTTFLKNNEGIEKKEIKQYVKNINLSSKDSNCLNATDYIRECKIKLFFEEDVSKTRELGMLINTQERNLRNELNEKKENERRQKEKDAENNYSNHQKEIGTSGEKNEPLPYYLRLAKERKERKERKAYNKYKSKMNYFVRKNTKGKIDHLGCYKSL